MTHIDIAILVCAMALGMIATVFFGFIVPRRSPLEWWTGLGGTVLSMLCGASVILGLHKQLRETEPETQVVLVKPTPADGAAIWNAIIESRKVAQRGMRNRTSGEGRGVRDVASEMHSVSTSATGEGGSGSCVPDGVHRP